MYAEACYKADDHDAADLCAQWRAALAAEKAAEATTSANWISGAGAFLSFISIILVVIALGQTRQANRLAARENGRNTVRSIAAAKDTEAAFALSEGTAQRQLRAYVSFHSAYIPNLETGPPLYIQAKWENGGQTPAFDLIGCLRYFEVKGNDTPENLLIQLPTADELKTGPYPVGPKGVFYTMDPVALPDGFLQRVAVKRMRVLVAAWIEYTDIFDKRQRTEMGLELIVEANKSGQLGIVFLPVKGRNTMT